MEHRPPADRPEELAIEPEELRFPARGARLDRPAVRPLRLRGRFPRGTSRAGSLHLVVKPRPGACQQCWLAHRLPGRKPLARRHGTHRQHLSSQALLRPRTARHGLPSLSTGASPRADTAAPGWLNALSIYRQPRVGAMLFLGFSAGLPFFLVYQTLSAWLRQAGIPRSTIGMLAWVGILFSIKFLWAPIIDRVPPPLLQRLLGRRRGWMLLAQLGIAVGLFNISLCDPAAGVRPLALWALFTAFCAATQDIALDAWRIESAPLQLQGAMLGAYQIGYRVALISGGAGALALAGRSGWHTSYAVMAALV